MKTMTNQQINIAIALTIGWTDCVFVESLKLTKGFPPPNNPPIYGTYENGMAQLPNYCNDLNVMHEVEKVIKKDSNLWKTYESLLARIVSGDCGMFHITANQRAEAFLKTIGKWEGAK